LKIIISFKLESFVRNDFLIFFFDQCFHIMNSSLVNEVYNDLHWFFLFKIFLMSVLF
jgi:hypothetical protein